MTFDLNDVRAVEIDLRIFLDNDGVQWLSTNQRSKKRALETVRTFKEWGYKTPVLWHVKWK
jgi:hypothetical protein